MKSPKDKNNEIKKTRRDFLRDIGNYSKIAAVVLAGTAITLNQGCGDDEDDDWNDYSDWSNYSNSYSDSWSNYSDGSLYGDAYI